MIDSSQVCRADMRHGPKMRQGADLIFRYQNSTAQRGDTDMLHAHPASLEEGDAFCGRGSQLMVLSEG